MIEGMFRVARRIETQPDESAQLVELRERVGLRSREAGVCRLGELARGRAEFGAPLGALGRHGVDEQVLLVVASRDACAQKCADQRPNKRKHGDEHGEVARHQELGCLGIDAGEKIHGPVFRSRLELRSSAST